MVRSSDLWDRVTQVLGDTLFAYQCLCRTEGEAATLRQLREEACSSLLAAATELRARGETSESRAIEEILALLEESDLCDPAVVARIHALNRKYNLNTHYQTPNGEPPVIH
jgi:hypothetical protein